MSKRIDAKDLIDKIEKLAKERIAASDVIDLKSLRGLKEKKERRSVLVIEDDATMRAVLKRILEGDGLEVKLAADGTELGQALGEMAVDLILLDVGLPWINGIELAKLLKEHEAFKEIPLVFISGKTSEFDIKRGFEAGADDYITKPFEIDNVKKTVQTLLRLRFD